MNDEMQYHIHDKGPGPWLMRLLRWDLRYSVCEGPPHKPPREGGSVLNCHPIHVASTMRGVRKVIRNHERERLRGRDLPFFQYPSSEVKP